MTSENVEKAKADAKKGMADIGNKMAHAKANAKADIKANAEKATSDIKASAKKATADVEKMKAD